MRILPVLVTVFLLFAAPASAATWPEAGDAGNTLSTAQATGPGTPDAITGALPRPDANTDEDIFAVSHPGGPFVASTQTNPGGDAALALLDANGSLLAANRDATDYRITFNSTEACVARTALPPGTYYLAVSSEPEMGQAGLEPFPNTGPQGYALTYTLHLGGTGCDIDRDTIEDSADNCPVHANTAQEDTDFDFQGDACDPDWDQDGDGVPNEFDNCDAVANPDQADADGDRIGDACETAEPAPETPWSGFTGFRPPVDDLPTLNIAKPGSTVPVKFSLGGDHGLDIFDAGYPRLTTCDATPGAAQTSAIEETAGGAASALTYDAAADQYLYAWKTSKQLRGCVQLELAPDAGDESPAPWARFWFK